MYKKFKKILIALIILGIIIIFFIIFLLKQYSSKNKFEGYDITQDQLGDIEVITYEKQALNNDTVFFTIEKCINNYLKNIKENNIVAIIDLLDKEYIKQNNITEQNLIQFINNIENDEEIYVTKIYEQKNNNVNTYIVKGILKKISKDKYFIVNLDDINLTYSIIPLLEKEYEDFEKIQYKNEENEIKINENNVYSYYRIKESEKVIKYFRYFKELMQNNKYDAYSLINAEYKEKKYQNFNNFQNIINRKDTENIEIKKYAKYDYDEYTQYVCIDNRENYYIFNEKATMQFDVILDTYTIPQPEFIEKYSKSNNQEKAGYNITQFFTAINDGDYKYAYNCLAESFKANNFKTYESFENYAKNKFYKNNEISYLSYSVEGGYSVYKVSIKDASENNLGAIQKNFIVNIKDGTDFEMSFSIE